MYRRFVNFNKEEEKISIPEVSNVEEKEESNIAENIEITPLNNLEQNEVTNNEEIIFKLGAKDKEVERIQEELCVIFDNHPNINKIPIDGSFGIQTKAMIEAFQAIYNLNVSGSIDKVTLNKITEVYEHKKSW
ncbi:MAG: peptidoglycan-binding protein [Lachnospiraceae bacterium]|jgi:peptidoglycan hydrolase-like protein with peptidoglycan-binding domain|nr:peptidoglycan-binding protein [Lachnospiraceae bacterium]